MQRGTFAKAGKRNMEKTWKDKHEENLELQSHTLILQEILHLNLCNEMISTIQKTQANV